MNALIDTNVVLDVLQNREPWAEDGKKLFLFAASGAFTGYLAATEISDLHYLIKEYHRNDGTSRNKPAFFKRRFYIIPVK